ncbi:MAG: GNAT family N-acetyltransferase [Sphingobacterium sp.]
MEVITFQKLRAGDFEHFRLIAVWYLAEWGIPIAITMDRLAVIVGDSQQLQLILICDGVPVATAGIYHHVGLIDKAPRFSNYKNWLALVYTRPDRRGKGYGSALCNYVVSCSQEMHIDALYLFTDTASDFYRKLGWQDTEHLLLDQRDIIVMRKTCAVGLPKLFL